MKHSPLKISIRGLRVFAHHGVFEAERANGQDFFIDADIWIDGKAAAANDDLAKTVHYGDLADALVASAKANPVDLIETLATRLLDLAMNFGGGETASVVKKAKITVHKPKAPIDHEFSDVSVTVKAKRK
jgi:dihydroneopterin aldolase